MERIIFTPGKIGSITVRNRIVFPPVGLHGAADHTGRITNERISQYEAIAAGGAGLIIVEFTAVSLWGRQRDTQLGLWDDAQMEPLERLTRRVHDQGAKICIQLHHAGAKTPRSISADVVSASDVESLGARGMTEREVEELVQNFACAAVRAQKSGFDGVELHAAHGYLLSQFASPLINHRTDCYGGEVADRVRVHCKILREIHEACGMDFVVGVRIGGNEPTYAEGVAIAEILEAAGADYLHVSFGLDEHYNIDTPHWITVPGPKGFRGNAVVYGGSLVKHAVNVPIIAVRSIRNAENGEWLLKNGHADFVAYARPMLANPDFVRRALEGVLPESECLDCPCCAFFSPEGETRCPAFARKQHRQGGR